MKTEIQTGEQALAWRLGSGSMGSRINRDNRDRGGLFIPFSLIVRNNIVIGMIVAEPGEDIDQLEWCEKRR